MRKLATALIILGGAMVIVPLAVTLIGLWLAGQADPAYHDTYYVVAAPTWAIPYLLVACGLIVGGVWTWRRAAH